VTHARRLRQPALRLRHSREQVRWQRQRNKRKAERIVLARDTLDELRWARVRGYNEAQGTVEDWLARHQQREIGRMNRSRKQCSRRCQFCMSPRRLSGLVTLQERRDGDAQREVLRELG
jgi:hypothetical protein